MCVVSVQAGGVRQCFSHVSGPTSPTGRLAEMRVVIQQVWDGAEILNTSVDGPHFHSKPTEWGDFQKQI